MDENYAIIASKTYMHVTNCATIEKIKWLSKVYNSFESYLLTRALQCIFLGILDLTTFLNINALYVQIKPSSK